MPTVWFHLVDQYQAFFDCRVTQPNGMGLCRISQVEMQGWFCNHGIPSDEQPEFVMIIMALDTVYIQHDKDKSTRSKSAKEKAAKAAQPKAPRSRAKKSRK